MKVLGIDQSLSKCAFICIEDGEVIYKSLSKTGASKVKTKRKDTTYYDQLDQQIHHICVDLENTIDTLYPDKIVFEALSFGSVGDATRNLACLFGAMKETIIRTGWEGEVLEVAPTSLKSYAHQFLKEDRKYDGVTATKKPKKVKMDKKLMVEAGRELNGQDFLSEYNYSTGLDDLNDAFFLAHKVYNEKKSS